MSSRTEDRRQAVLENQFHRHLIEAALNHFGKMEREKMFLFLKERGASRTRFNLAMQWLLKNKKIWKVGREYEIRTETAKL